MIYNKNDILYQGQITTFVPGNMTNFRHHKTIKKGYKTILYVKFQVKVSTARNICTINFFSNSVFACQNLAEAW